MISERRWIVCLVALACVTGCAPLGYVLTPDAIEEASRPGHGLLVVSLAPSEIRQFWTFSPEGTTELSTRLADGSQRPDPRMRVASFDRGEGYKGIDGGDARLHVLSLPAGDYYFHTYGRVPEASWARTLIDFENRLRFSITPGEVTYIGRIYARRRADDAFAYDTSISDDSEADRALFVDRYPDLASWPFAVRLASWGRKAIGASGPTIGAPLTH